MKTSSWNSVLKNRKNLGILCILFASVMWAMEPVAAKIAYENSDFLHTSAVRAVFACVIAFFYVAVRNKKLKLERRYLPPIIYIAIMGTIFADLLYFYAISRIPVVNAVIIGHMQPIFIILLGFIILREKLTSYDYGGIFFMILSGIMVTTKTPENLLSFRIGTTGDAMVLIATISWATTALVARKYLHSIDGGVITFYRFFISSLLFLIYTVSTSAFIISNIYQIMTGFIVGTGTILYYEGLRRLKAAQVSAMELSAPFFAAVLGFLILHENITSFQILGILSLAGGIYYISRKEE